MKIPALTVRITNKGKLRAYVVQSDASGEVLGKDLLADNSTPLPYARAAETFIRGRFGDSVAKLTFEHQILEPESF